MFPNSTILVDTYDTISAVKSLIRENIKPDTVRIDSGKLDILCFEVRKILDDAGWNDVKIFISGDLTSEILIDYEARGVPFDKCMAGTKFVNVGLAKFTNAGYVYKIVEYTIESDIEIDRITIYPQKKAEGKSNYPGLKHVTYEDGKIFVRVNRDEKQSIFGFEDNVFDAPRNVEIVFDINVD
jgi:nicotinate phosphoribosyltransferase